MVYSGLFRCFDLYSGVYTDRGTGIACSKRKRADPVSMSVTFSVRLSACSKTMAKRQAC